MTGLSALPIAPGNKPGHGLDDQARSDLAAVQHHVADAELAVDEVLTHPMVDALVAAAQQAEPVADAASSTGQRLVEPSAAGPEQEQRTWRIGRLDRVEQWLGLHQHAGAPAERRVVDRAVDVGRLVAGIVQPQVDAARSSRALPSRLSEQNPSTRPGNSVKTSIRIGSLSRPGRTGPRADRS